MKKIVLSGLFAVLLSSLLSARAMADSYWSGPSSVLRLQDYAGMGVMVWWVSGVPANCPQGSGLYTSNLSTDDKKLFYATVLGAKLSSHSVYIYYNPSSCQINSFGMDN